MQSSTPSELELVPEAERHSTASGAEMLAQHLEPTMPATTKASLHLPYLDGIRALMALYVVNNHLIDAVGFPHGPFGVRPFELIQMLHQGHYAVAVFIVLSGYCLMLPVLRDNGALRGGNKTFFTRRARRILPPYYAALLGAIIVSALIAHASRHPDSSITSPQGLGLHLSLLHNLSRQHIYDYNGALWSIATEWQIYFLFPFLFLPLWRRFGEGVLMAVAIALVAIIVLAFPSIARGCPWFIILFALGMVAARWSLEPSSWMKRIPWAWLGVALVTAMYFVARIVPRFDWFEIYSVNGRVGWYQLTDLVFGFATFCFLLHGTRATLERRASKFLSVLTWRPLVFVGAFSYSLYLIHMPIQDMVIRFVHRFAMPRPVLYSGMVLLYIPFVVLAAYGFYQLFERPFIGSPKPRKRDTEPASS